MDIGEWEPTVTEMTVPESAWTRWSMAGDVNTNAMCTCGHEGLGPAWHLGECRGANWALGAKVRELMNELYEEWSSNHAEHCDNAGCDHADGGKCFWPLPDGLKA